MNDRRISQQPTLVVAHHGTISLEDRMSGYVVQPFEINDVQLSFINDPLNLVTITGSAGSPMIGSVQVQGLFHRLTKELELKVKTKATPSPPIFCNACRWSAATALWPGLAVEATRVDVDASLAYRPGQEVPLEHNILVQVAKGKLRHPKLPLPLEDIHARLECDNGMVRADDFQARSGQTVIKGQGVGPGEVSPGRAKLRNRPGIAAPQG